MKYLENSMIENWLSGYNTAQRLRHATELGEHENNRRVRAAYEALKNSTDPFMRIQYAGWCAARGEEAN